MIRDDIYVMFEDACEKNYGHRDINQLQSFDEMMVVIARVLEDIYFAEKKTTGE
jgi:hypothetical protein